MPTSSAGSSFSLVVATPSFGSIPKAATSLKEHDGVPSKAKILLFDEVRNLSAGFNFPLSSLFLGSLTE